MSVLFVFVDGVGLGTRGAHNPFEDAGPIGRVLAGASPPRGFEVALTDATLGVPGLPQSATGQAALLTGVNAAALLGRHLWAYPNAALCELLARESVLRAASDRGARVAFLNAFTPKYADPRSDVRRGAFTVAAIASGVPLRTIKDAHAGRAVGFDLTGDVMRAWKIDAPRRTVAQAGAVLASAARECDLAVFEYFLTDKAGHARDRTWAREEVRKIEAFIEAVAALLDPARDLLVVTSDHGNLDDISTRSHTFAPVATLCFGRGAAAFAARVRSLTDLAPALLERACEGLAAGAECETRTGAMP